MSEQLSEAEWTVLRLYYTWRMDGRHPKTGRRRTLVSIPESAVVAELHGHNINVRHAADRLNARGLLQSARPTVLALDTWALPDGRSLDLRLTEDRTIPPDVYEVLEARIDGHVVARMERRKGTGMPDRWAAITPDGIRAVSQNAPTRDSEQLPTAPSQQTPDSGAAPPNVQLRAREARDYLSAKRDQLRDREEEKELASKLGHVLLQCAWDQQWLQPSHDEAARRILDATGFPPDEWHEAVSRLHGELREKGTGSYIPQLKIHRTVQEFARWLPILADALQHLAGRGPLGKQSEPPPAPSQQTPNDTLDHYRSADWFAARHGIPQSRLSEGANANPPRVCTKRAPAGQVDSQGRVVRVLYHVGDALRYCSPKHVKGKTRRRSRTCRQPVQTEREP